MPLDQLATVAAAGPAAEPAARTIRVATVPASHVYVRHLDPVHPVSGLPRIDRLPDPDPDDPRRSTVSTWWPPVMLRPEWVREHADEFDVFHLQFGFDARTPAELAELAAALREAGRPFVYTVHDLRNPHHETREAHDAQLDVLIPAADALITLTPGAAEEIRRRWGRVAHVLPHPHVVDTERMRAAHARREAEPVHPDRPFRVGVHVKSLRPSMNPHPVLRVLADAVADIPGGVLQVNGHRDVLEPGGAKFDAALAEYLRAQQRRGRIDLRVHDFLPDDELWEYLESLDVSVLPYRFGTHSGWLEACRDLGTAVIAPDCGYYREQGPVLEYHNHEGGVDAASLHAAVRQALALGRPRPASGEERIRERQLVASAHAHLYRSLM
ncbi:glycosyltransferase family protein [Microbacterium caowuchunii]|uniref:glycosyltransferase n=1 Tax=Microbacterium caowuchunii TaxID=2614638 RepID=UPI001CD2D170|nr:glycosyltransferase [Microbacterium caowuchunii]